jgi:hypothetical protein
MLIIIYFSKYRLICQVQTFINFEP